MLLFPKQFETNKFSFGECFNATYCFTSKDLVKQILAHYDFFHSRNLISNV